MRKINLETFFHIISEPGDATRYDYALIKHENSDMVTIASIGNDFPYPAKMSWFDAKQIKTIEIAMQYAEDELFNMVDPHTVLEVARAIDQIMSEI